MEQLTENREHYLDDAFKDVESLEKFLATLARDGNLPDHFYLKNGKGKPDYSEPNIGMLLLIVSWGEKLHIPFTQAMQQIIPLEGKMCIRGDLAKALIFDRGSAQSWEEKYEGSIEKGDYRYTIIAKRKDIELGRSFTLWEAKQKGLYPSPAKLQGPNKAAWLKSPWYTYPERMCMYRALGFIARDLWPDVMGGLILQEEVADYPDMGVIRVELPEGEIELTDRSGKEERSESMTQQAVKEMDKNGTKDPLQERSPVESKKLDAGKITPGEAVRAAKDIPMSQMIAGKPVPEKFKYTVTELIDMKDRVVHVAEALGIMDQIRNQEGKNTNKKIRTAILIFQEIIKKPEEYVEQPVEKEIPVVGEPITDEEPPVIKHPAAEATPVVGDAIEETPEQEMREVTEQPADDQEKESNSNPWLFIVPIRDEDGERSFENLSKVFRELGNHNITDENYPSWAKKILRTMGDHEEGEKIFAFHPDKETFCLKASVVEINSFIAQVNDLS